MRELSLASTQDEKTEGRTGAGETVPFEVRIGLHQGSVSSPLLFILAMNTISVDMHRGAPEELFFC